MNTAALPLDHPAPHALFAKLAPIATAREWLAAAGIDPFGVAMERILSPTEALVAGRRTILAGTNNYLGLTFDPDCQAAARESLAAQGTGTTGSRMANGSFSSHRELEREFAAFYDQRDCIVFSTGYLANLGMISALAGPDDVIVLDADCHASIYDGCKLGGAEVIRFRHNDPADLARRLRRLGARAERCLIIVEGLYSMLGDLAPLADIAAVKRQYGGLLMVDEAHSLGIFGARGRGVSEWTACENEVDFIVGTFSKSLGATGGFCVSNHPQLDHIRYASRPYIFTASPAPSIIASTRVALAKLAAGDDLRRQLHANARRLHAGLAALGLDLGAPPGPVVAVTIPGKERALGFWKKLLENGVYCNMVLPPATPSGDPLLRLSVSAAHDESQIDRIIEVFTMLHGELAGC